MVVCLNVGAQVIIQVGDVWQPTVKRWAPILRSSILNWPTGFFRNGRWKFHHKFVSSSVYRACSRSLQTASHGTRTEAQPLTLKSTEESGGEKYKFVQIPVCSLGPLFAVYKILQQPHRLQRILRVAADNCPQMGDAVQRLSAMNL